MEHVRGGMPPPPLVRKPNYRRQQKERMQLVDYIERHRILKNDNLDNGKEENL